MFGKRQRNVNVLFETVERLAQSNLYQQVVHDLYEALRQLRQNLSALIDGESFRTLRARLPEWQRPLQRFASLIIGIRVSVRRAFHVTGGRYPRTGVQ